jgi:hypothetical protein
MKTSPSTPPEGEIARLIDEQLELAAARLGALDPGRVHPSPVDHEERPAAHANAEDLLLGNAQATPEMLEEWRALETPAALSDEELARQAMAQATAPDEAGVDEAPVP